MKEKLCFVQFIHPGGEHRPDNANCINWNRKPHKRKFVKNPGEYYDGKKISSGIITFWCEWEPESRVIDRIKEPISYGPNYIYEPYYKKPECYDGLQTTDPFVFGEHFHYTGCQQNSSKGPNQLRYLQIGSVILFGSCLNSKHFVLDTVFVVEKWIDHNPNNFKKVLKDEISEVYFDVGIMPWYQDCFHSCNSSLICGTSLNKASYRLYYGANFNSQVNDMYSFFPCLPYEDNKKGFVRPIIKIPNVITDNLPRGKKLNRQSDIQRVKELWDIVVFQVLKQGLKLGVYTDLPNRE